MRKNLYLFLSIAGFIFPYYFFISFLSVSGLDFGAFVRDLFSTRVSAFFATDLLIASIVFLIWLRPEARRHNMRRWWLYLVGTLLVGLSFALPIFLYVRESSRERAAEAGGRE